MPSVYASDLPALPGSGTSAPSNIEFDFSPVSLFDWFVDAGTVGMNWLRHFFDDDVCPGNPNRESRHNFVQRHTQVDGKPGYYYICEYCGKSAGEVGKDAYAQRVSDLPAMGVTSEGHLIWRITGWEYASSGGFSVLYYTETQYPYYQAYTPGAARSAVVPSVLFSVPYTGTYRIVFPVAEFDKEWWMRNNEILDVYNLLNTAANSTVPLGPISGNFSQVVALFSDVTYKIYVPVEILIDVDVINGISSYRCFYPYIEFLDTPGFDTLLFYSPDSRPTTITGGNYGIVGDDGQLTIVNGDIINEGDNIYYNPVTGNTGTINNWSYNYGDRSYNLTLGDGSTATVTYGDENITIIEGDVTYIIYYVIEGSGGGSEDGCTHEWELTNRIEGNCVNPEKRTYTCKLCGKQYTETDPVLGHSWHIIQTVSTKYDEEGNLIQEGYTVYECERCGEQYKATNDTGPPPSGGGGSDNIDGGGLAEFFNGLIKFLSDNLSGLVGLIKRFFTEIPGLFGGFTEFLSAVFPFLPPEVTMLLTFGMAAVVVIGIIRAIRR